MIKAHGKDAREIAKKISECIYKDQRTHGIYCNCLAKLLINSKTEEKAITWINIIKEFKTIEKIYIEIIWKEYGKNPICLKPNILDKLNLLFKDYGFPTKFSNFSYTEMETEDLPF